MPKTTELPIKFAGYTAHYAGKKDLVAQALAVEVELRNKKYQLVYQSTLDKGLRYFQARPWDSPAHKVTSALQSHEVANLAESLFTSGQDFILARARTAKFQLFSFTVGWPEFLLLGTNGVSLVYNNKNKIEIPSTIDLKTTSLLLRAVDAKHNGLYAVKPSGYDDFYSSHPNSRRGFAPASNLTSDPDKREALSFMRQTATETVRIIKKMNQAINTQKVAV